MNRLIITSFPNLPFTISQKSSQRLEGSVDLAYPSDFSEPIISLFINPPFFAILISVSLRGWFFVNTPHIIVCVTLSVLSDSFTRFFSVKRNFFSPSSVIRYALRIARLHGFYHIHYFIFFTPKNQALLTKNFSFRFSFDIIFKDGSKTY